VTRAKDGKTEDAAATRASLQPDLRDPDYCCIFRPHPARNVRQVNVKDGSQHSAKDGCGKQCFHHDSDLFI
jgi:hypothetical protein